MCGIAGLIDYSNKTDKIDLLNRMIGYLGHRGPDATGIFNGPLAGLAHSRLSIIDLSGGDQPIHNEDKTLWVVFNGEIFNYPELRANLIESGHKFYTQSDTEVLVHLYESYGLKMFDKLNGQFAFALWDEKKEQLVLGRDRVGIRPLFYYHRHNRLLFGSEIKALFELIHHRQDEMEMDYCWTVDELRAANAALDTETATRMEKMAAQLASGEKGLREALAAAKTEMMGKIEISAREMSNLNKLLAETQTSLKKLAGRMEALSQTDGNVRSEINDIRRSIEEIRSRTEGLEKELQSVKSSGPVPDGRESGPQPPESQELQ